MLAKLAGAHAHKLLAKLIQLGVVADAPVTVSAKAEIQGLQVVITIAGYQPLRVAGEIPALAGSPAGKLTPLMQQIVALLTREKPSKAEWIAMKLGKKCGGSFRSLLADIVRLGAATHVKGRGYLLA